MKKVLGVSLMSAQAPKNEANKGENGGKKLL